MGEIALLPLVSIGLLVGTVLGLTGAGGSILAVPALMALTHWSLSQAAPAALVAVASAALIGSLGGIRKGIVRYRAAALLALSALPAAPLGLQAALFVPEYALLMLFASLLFWVGLRTLRSVGRERGTAVPIADRAMKPPPCMLNRQTGRFGWPPRCFAAMGALGMMTGGLSGLLGVGGGFIIVPGLRRISDLPMHSAVATSLLAAALTATETLGIAIISDRLPPIAPIAPFLAATVIGMLVARSVAARLSSIVIARGFALTAWIVCGYLLWKA